MERINEIIDQVKKAIATLTEEISVLREYKVRLVADTVTGKIDVRDVEIPKHEFVEDNINNIKPKNDKNLEEAGAETYEE